MRQIEYFVPGNLADGQDEEVLPRLRWPIPSGVIETYVEAYTRPGDKVLLPYCQSAAEVRTIRKLNRQPLAIHYDPVLMLVVQAALFPVSARDLDGAVARLADSRKQGIPLRRHLEALYATTCPACLRPAIASFFLWEQGAPVAKHVQCPACQWDGRTGVEPADLDRLAEIPARGLHYHYILDRIAPHPEGNALRARLEPLLDLYTPRNLSALADLILKIEALFPEGSLRQMLLTLLLDCLDRCSALAPLPGSTGRRRMLSRPARFIERNVWQAFEQAVARFRNSAARPVPIQASTVHKLGSKEGTTEQGYVGPGTVRDLSRALPSQSLSLILVSPPPLDPAAWSLSYLWGAWLLDWEAVAPLRPLLRQRSADPAWYARVLSGSLRTLGDLLCEEGRLLVILTGQRPAVLEALLWAAARARLQLIALLQSGGDYRLEFSPGPPPDPLHTLPLDLQIKQTVLNVATEEVQVRGEPVSWRVLHAEIYGRLAETGLLARAAQENGEEGAGLEIFGEQVRAMLDEASLVRLSDDDGNKELLWSTLRKKMAPPLADRVEAVAFTVLHERSPLDEATFFALIYAQFPGQLTPEPGLIRACLEAYGHELAPGRWQLRPEDRPENREPEQREIVTHLVELGERLGYRARAWAPFDAAWFEENEVRAAFVVRWQASVAEALASGQKGKGARLYLVIPGGRAALVTYKLAHNPLWQRTLDEAGWRFIKYRHVRELVAEADVDEYALQTIVGLDPIVEREAVQIPLF